MNVDFSKGCLTVVVTPVDLRAGWRRLSAVARGVLGIDIDAGGQFVAFVSRDRSLCKIIWRDESGSCVLVRRLHRGRFERFLVQASNPQVRRQLSPDDFIAFLDGRPLFARPSPLYV